MKTKRAILTGIGIWIAAILCYSIASYSSLSETIENLPNIVLFIVIMPLVWFGCSYYYKSNSTTHGYIVGQTMLLTAVALDALITVPLFIIPNGGSYYSFFTDIGFWVIAFEFIVIAVLHYYIKVYPKFTLVNKLKNNI